MSQKTIYQLIGSRDNFRFIKAASYLEPDQVAVKLSEFKSRGLVTIVRPTGTSLMAADEFHNPEARGKYFQQLMSEFFEYVH